VNLLQLKHFYYNYTAHLKKYTKLIQQLKVRFPEINAVDKELHKISDTEAERIEHIL
jgi:hypothetical protein